MRPLYSPLQAGTRAAVMSSEKALRLFKQRRFQDDLIGRYFAKAEFA